MNLSIQIAEHDSLLYKDSVNLRRRVLRIPLGLDFSAEELMAENDQVHFVVLDDEDVIACAVFVWVNPAHLKMRQVAVAPEFQGRRIGRELVREMERWARANEVKSIELNARESAVQFYLGLRYKIVGDPFEEVGIPHSKMIKRLDS